MAASCSAPLASIAIAGVGESWVGSEPARPLAAPDHDPFRTHVARATDFFDVPDVILDPRFHDAPLQVAEVRIRSCLGIALRNGTGRFFGTLTIYGAREGCFGSDHRRLLDLLCRQLLTMIELTGRIAELEIFAAEPGRVTAGADLACSLLESASVVIYHTDASGNITYANPEYRRIFGLQPQQSTNDWVQGVHPEDRPRMEDAWEDFSRRPRSVQFNYRTQPADGSIRYFSERVVPVRGGDGYVGSISDFTDLVEARDELRKAESLFQNTFEQAPIGIAYKDRSGALLRWNGAFCALLGLRPDELTARSMIDLTHQEDAGRTARDLERLWAGEVESLDVERRYVRADGSTVWARATVALVRDGGDAPQFAVEFLRDITQRKALSAAIEEQRTLLETVIGNLPVALLACDGGGTITRYNRAAIALPCIETAPRVALTPVCQSDGATRVEMADHPLNRALRGENIDNFELTITAPDGTARSILANARRLVGADGRGLGAVAVIQDTTERKLAELELERVHKELMSASRRAGMAEVATNVLHNVGNILNSINISASLVAERVKQSKAPGVSRVAALLREQGAEVGRFIASDDRGKQIPSYLATLGEQLLSDQRITLEELTLLRENLEHIKETVTMQQSYAKLCGVTETVEVANLVEDSLRLNAGAFARHGVTLSREFATVPALTVDKHKVLQILVNLVRNAKYACDESGRSDKLLTLRIAASETGVGISVIDNGVGIPMENMGRLFTHGFTTRRSGHGFGLHSCAVAAQELGGSLHAYSAGPGCGSTFVLQLPLAPKESSHE